jgi:putative addiction module component (TIGR02574 family)
MREGGVILLKALYLPLTPRFPEPAMTQTADTLSKQAAQLPPAERMALVERILDSLDAPDPTMDALWAKEADERLAAYRRGEISAIPLSEVLAKYQVSRKAA